MGVDGADRDRDHAALVNALFEPIREESVGLSSESDPTDWSKFIQALARCRRLVSVKELREEPSWTAHLLNLIGARQGGSSTVYAVDLLRLRPTLEETLKSWELSANLPDPKGVPDFSPIRTTYSELKRLTSAIGDEQRRLFSWHKQTQAWLGNDADKEVFVQNLNDTVEAARVTGLMSNVSAKQLFASVEAFRTAKVKTALEDAAKLDDKAPRGLILSILGRGYEPVVKICENLRAQYEQFIGSVDGQLRSELSVYGADPMSEAMRALHTELDELTSLLERTRI
jgi:hypothetical protein